MAPPERRATHFHGILTGLVRDEELHGRPHLVAPAVLVREMVLGEGEEAELLPRSAIEESADLGLWNGRPVTLGHPQKNGEFVLAGDVTLAEQLEVGRLFNVSAASDGKLKGEVWVDAGVAERTEDGQRLLSRLESFREAGPGPGNPPLEGSTGYVAAVVSERGRHQGRTYSAKQAEIVPDHFAVLLDGKGKCSVEDGCGLPRLNADGDRKRSSNEPDAGPEADADPLERAARQLVDRVRRLVGLDKDAGSEATTQTEDGTMESREDVIAALLDCEECPFDEERLNEMSGETLYAVAQARSVDLPDELTANELALEQDPEGAGADEAEGDSDADASKGKEPQANADAELLEWVRELREEHGDELGTLIEEAAERRKTNEEKAEELRKELAANETCAVGEEVLAAMNLKALEGVKRTVEQATRRPVYAGRGGPRQNGEPKKMRATTPAIVSRSPEN